MSAVSHSTHFMSPLSSKPQDKAEGKKLQNSWSVYFTEKVPRDAQFKDNLQKVCTFKTVEEFAYVYSRLRRPSQLPSGTSMYVVRDANNSVPAWEANIHGGTYQLKRTIDPQSTHVQKVDQTWENVLFAMVGETIQEPILSCVQATARQDSCQITVWHFGTITKRAFSRIQLKLGDLLGCKVADIEYVTNMDAIKNKQLMRDRDQQKKEQRAKNAEEEAAKKETAKEAPKEEAPKEAPKEADAEPQAKPARPHFQIVVQPNGRRRNNNRRPSKNNDKKSGKQ